MSRRNPISLARLMSSTDFLRIFWTLLLSMGLCMPLYQIGFRPGVSAAQEPAIEPTRSPDWQITVDRYCLDCHGESDPEGGISLSVDSQPEWMNDPEQLVRIVDVLRANEMPPEDAEQPSQEELRSLVQSFSKRLHEAIAKSSDSERPSLRRMNRFQYNNAVEDLFELNCIVFTLPEKMLREHNGYFDPASGKMPSTVIVGSRPLGKSQMIEPRLAGVAAFPQDLRAENGFDNRIDHLSMSPLLMESFLKLGQSIVDSPDFTQQRVGIWKEFFAEPKIADQPRDETRRQAVRERLDTFLRRAFRGGADRSTVDRYSAYAVARLDRGDEFTTVMKSVAAAAIASPRFLYLYDNATAPASRSPAIDLASRLSFFLWGSVPDRHLMGLAESGELLRRDTLESEVDRLLNDRKLKRFCDSFPAQWMQLERIISAVPDREQFPQFYYAKYRDSMHMMAEPLLLFETVLIENRPITELIDPAFTYRSLHLRESYGEDVRASKPRNRRTGEVTRLTFDRLPIDDRRYGGVITNAAVLTMTSGTKHTKPITRGAWLATVVFNDPPPPPPADVPALPEKPHATEAHLTIRERLAKHRERSDCRGCHEQIDPLGFALEHYDPVGAWRETYENDLKIDMAGTLFRKHDFASVPEFKDAILVERQRFVRGFTGHLLSFALARELDAADWFVVDQIVEQAESKDFRMRDLIKAVVTSKAFCGDAAAPNHQLTGHTDQSQDPS